MLSINCQWRIFRIRKRNLTDGSSKKRNLQPGRGCSGMILQFSRLTQDLKVQYLYTTIAHPWPFLTCRFIY